MTYGIPADNIYNWDVISQVLKHGVTKSTTLKEWNYFKCFAYFLHITTLLIKFVCDNVTLDSNLFNFIKTLSDAF